MLEDGLSYPFNSDNTIAQHLIGGVLWVFSFLLIPAFLVAGYYMDAMRSVINGDDAPPSFGEWGRYMRDGVFAVLVVLAYSLIPVLVFAAFVVFSGIFGGATGNEELSVFFIIAVVLPMTVLYFLATYFLPGAIAHVVNKESPVAAFSFGELKKLWFSKTYLIATLIYIIGGFIITIGFWIVGLVTFGLAFLLYPFFLHYYYLFGVYVFAEAYRDVYQTA